MRRPYRFSFTLPVALPLIVVAVVGVVADGGAQSTQAPPSPSRALFADVAPRYRLVAKDFHDMLEGQLADLGDRDGSVRCATWDELRTVCYRVASTVGLVCIRVWGYSDPRAIDFAIDRGIAFQLTNILRDVREDFGHRRTYLPQDELERFGVSVESLLAWRDEPFKE